MKRLAVVLAFLTFTATAFAQHTMSRETYFGVTDASVTSYATKTIVDAASATIDSVTLAPAKKITIVRVNLVDSAAIKLTTTGMFYGDEVHVDVVNPAFSNILYLFGNWIVSTGTKRIALTASKSSYLRFWFNGSDLVEASRNLNYTR